MEQWLSEWMFAIRAPTTMGVIKGVTDDGRTPLEIMEQLRRDDPDAHALLSEWLVLGAGEER